MWTVVYMSRDKVKVDKILSLLDSKEIMTMLKSAGEDDFETEGVFEILVPGTELEIAQDIIFDSELEN